MGKISKWLNRTFKSINPKNKGRGQTAEWLAEKYLKKHGLILRHRNYSTKSGEIDLVMSDGTEWVFVEVRYKHSQDWASPAESITSTKQRKVIKAAQHYLQKFDRKGEKGCRFDAILMSGDLHSPQIEWIKQAFY